MRKGKYCVSVSPEVWEMAKIKLGEPISQFLETQLRLACNINNEKARIEQELATKEKEILALRHKLCQLDKEKEIKLDAGGHVEACVPTINRIIKNLGFVGRNQLYGIASQHESVEVKDLVSLCDERGWRVIDHYEPPNEGKGVWDKRNIV